MGFTSVARRMGFASFAVLALIFSGLAVPTGARAVTIETPDPGEEAISQLIVTYEPGVKTQVSPKEATGSDRISTLGLEPGHDIGGGMRTIELSSDVTVATAEEISAILTADPRIKWAEPDRVVQPTVDAHNAVGAPRELAAPPRPLVPEAGVEASVTTNDVSPQTTCQAAESVEPVARCFSDPRGDQIGGAGANADIIYQSSYVLASNSTRLVVDVVPSTPITNNNWLDSNHRVLVLFDVNGDANEDFGVYAYTASLVAGASTNIFKYDYASSAYTCAPCTGSITRKSGSLDTGTEVVSSWWQFSMDIEQIFGGDSPSVRAIGMLTESQTAYDVAPEGFSGQPMDLSQFRSGAAKVTSVSPASGSMQGGKQVTVSGQNLATVTSVTFNGAPAQIVAGSKTATSVQVVTPPGAAGDVRVGAVNTVGSGSKSAAYTFDRTGPVDVTLWATDGSTKSAKAYEYVAPATPVITSLSPTTGPTTGGTRVTISGANFVGTSSVQFGGSNGTLVSVNASTIVVDTPAHGAGAVNVEVTNSAGVAALSGSFTYIAPPTVTTVTPSSGPLAGGTTVTIGGANLSAVTSVTFGGTSAPIQSTSDSVVIVTSPAKAAGAVAVAVTSPGGTATLASGYTYVPAPTISAVSPVTGTTAGGTVVSITGTNLATTSAVLFGSDPVADRGDIVSTGAGTVTVKTPAHVAGVVNVVLTTAGGSVTRSSAFTFGAPPVVSSVSPTSGNTAGGTLVTISGTNLATAQTVRFGSSSVTVASTSRTDTRVTVTAPARSSGTVDVTVVTSFGQTVVVGGFTYAGPPTVTSISPNAGPLAGGGTVTISGGNLGFATAVRFGSRAASIQSVSPSAVTVTVPAGAATGLVNVAVDTPSGTVTRTSAYTYVAAATVTSVSPNSGTTLGGQTIKISGTNLATVSSVTINGSNASIVASSKTATSFQVVTPAGPAGAVDIVVTTAAGSVTRVGAYTYKALPTVTSVAPNSGRTTGGTTVTITGTNLSTATRVSFATTATSPTAAEAATIVSATATTLTVTTPAHASGTVSVVVVTPDGTVRRSSSYTYVVIASVSTSATRVDGSASTATSTSGDVHAEAAATVTSLTPNVGAVAGGETVVISGSNMTAVTSVYFGENQATILSRTTTSITVTAPPASAVADAVGDQYYANGSMWGLNGTQGMRVDQAWSKTQGNPNMVVAVIDTGDLAHEDRGKRVAGYDFISSSARAGDGDGWDSDPSDMGDSVTADDKALYGFTCSEHASSWHGTHVAGTINGAKNGKGIVGVAPGVKVQAVRVLGKCGGSMSDIVAGINWAAGVTVSGAPANATPAKVINMSLGALGTCGVAEQSAINTAVTRGTVVVVAAGNDNASASGYSPASCSNVITVAAVDSTGMRASFSNYGSVVEIAAPGVGIYSTLNTGLQGPESDTYVAYDGTSMATPHVAGVVALILSREPALTPAQVLARVQASVHSFGSSACDPNLLKTCGSGILDANAAVR